MINTKHINTLPLSIKNILKFIDDEQIFRRYIPYQFEIGEVFSAPYRVDKNPSFGIYYSDKANKLLYKDLAKKDGGDCFTYVMKHVYGCTLWEACQQINKDFNLGFGNNGYSIERLKDKNNNYNLIKEKQRKNIEFLKQDYTNIDLDYWGQYGISKETLEFYNVFSCKCFYVDNELRRCYVDNFPIYAYYFPRTTNCKIYIPHAPKYEKWFTNANNDKDIMGYDQLPKNDDLIYITKSMKDVMCLYELGFNAVATHGEGHYINPDFIRHLRGRFKKIILFYDNDEDGKICSSKMSEQLGLESYFLPDNTEKDISDFIKKYGKEETWKVLR
jgi:hypothetical protein